MSAATRFQIIHHFGDCRQIHARHRSESRGHADPFSISERIATPTRSSRFDEMPTSSGLLTVSAAALAESAAIKSAAMSLTELMVAHGEFAGRRSNRLRQPAFTHPACAISTGDSNT